MKTLITFGVSYALLQFFVLMSDSRAAAEYNQDSEVHVGSKDHQVVERQGKVNDLSRDYQVRSNILKTKSAANAGPEAEGPLKAIEPNSVQEIQNITDGSGGGTRPMAVGGGAGKRKYAGDYDPAGTPKGEQGKGLSPIKID